MRRGTVGFALAVGAAAVGASVVTFPPLFGFIVVVLLGALALVLLVHTLGHASHTRRVMRWTLFSFALHVAIGASLLASRSAVLYLAQDALFYHEHAISLVQRWNAGLPALPLASGKAGFSYLLAALYWLLGPHPIVGVVANAAIAASIVPILTDTTARLFGDRAGRRTPLLVACLPGIVLWPSLLLREAGVLLLLAVVANCCVRLAQRTSPLAIGVVALALPLLFTFRGYIALVVAAGMMVGLSLGRREVFAGLAAGMTVAGVIATLVFGLGLGYRGYKDAVKADLSEAQVVRNDLAETAHSGFDLGARVSTPAEAVAYLPKAVPQFLFGPFPWQIHGARQLPALGDTVIWLALVPFAWRGFREALITHGRRLLPLLGPGAAVVVTLSLLAGNFGFLVRERPQVLMFLMPFVALGLASRFDAASGVAADGTT